MSGLLVQLWVDESGQGLVEYGLLVGFVALIVVASASLFGPSVNNILTRLNTYLEGHGAGS